MKKIFHLQQENKNPDRLLESIKHEIRKYLKRERGKKLPEKAVFWDFDCRFGQNSEEAHGVLASEIITALDKAHTDKWEQCYVEIIARAAYKAEVETDESEKV
ncbi:DUF6172 family protein [Sulfurimonas sp. HSL3-7]|uniref:DUF6172 family protein n=1 Tax=Sulfonitrofixus jiaomeiensis TaxID=3131938 RepID=UPI0031F9C0E4